MERSRAGIVFLAETVFDDVTDPSAPAFYGHWELVDPPTFLERGPGWASPEGAIEWGRARADIVLIRIGMPGTYYSAGSQRDESLSEWPPPHQAATDRCRRR
jgi:hypothetical protein